MRRLVLLGAPGTKRAVYLMKAADQAGIPIEIWDWRAGVFRGLAPGF